jgi:hypothetical protein
VADRLFHRTIVLIIVGCSGVLLSGCGRLGAMSRVDPLSIAVYPGGESRRDTPNNRNGRCSSLLGVGSYSRGAIDLSCFYFPEDALPATASGTAGRDAASPNPAPRLAYARAVGDPRDRNRLTALLLKHSDDICVEELGRLTANEATVNTSLSIVNTGVTTAANIVSGELAQQILTGIGTFTGASRSHFNSYVYRNTFPHAISRAISIERQRLRTLIEARYTQDSALFTVDDAIRSANEYHGVCSFFKGLELVLASVEGDQRSRDALVRQTQVDVIDQEIRRQEQAMVAAAAAGGDTTSYRTTITNLHARRSALLLAGIPDPTAKVPENPQPGANTPVTSESDLGNLWRYEGADIGGAAPPAAPWPEPTP